jgi:hypothetical protein
MLFYLKMVVYGRMVKVNEEHITKSILLFLKSKDWNIFSFDYPQSGTGFFIHPNDRNDKNKDSLIPDIIANKSNTCIIMENKSYYYHNDFLKLNDLKSNINYINDLNNIKNRLKCDNILYGIGLPNEKKIISRSKEDIHLIDFIIAVNESSKCEVIFD